MCKLLNISRQTYYRLKRCKNKQIKIKQSYATIDKLVIHEFYSNYKRYGSDKISIVLNKKGYDISKYKVLKSMKRQELMCLYNKSKKYKKFNFNNSDIPNVVNRRFKSSGIISSDLTYIKLGQQYSLKIFMVKKIIIQKIK